MGGYKNRQKNSGPVIFLKKRGSENSFFSFFWGMVGVVFIIKKYCSCIYVGWVGGDNSGAMGSVHARWAIASL